MTFADVDPKVLTLPGVDLDYSEVTITRRVYRDGTGEYLINKTPCRLKDIHTMFLDTGIGRSSYSLMAQGQIDQILSAHPEDRRNIFEEAAGINKYKHQKKEAMRKLEYTEANLVRLTDIIKEVKRQIGSLQRQAGKARRYKEIYDQLKALDTKLARHKFDLLQTDIATLEGQLAEIASLSEQFTNEIVLRETNIAQLRDSLAQLDQAISELVRRDQELKGEADRHEQRIATNNERIAEFEQWIANHHRDIAGAEEKIRIQEDQLSQLKSQLEQVDADLAVSQEQLRLRQADYDNVNAELTGKNRAASSANVQLLELERSIAHTRNEIAALDHKKKHDLLRAERLSAEQLQLQDHKRALELRVNEFNAGLAELRDAVDAERSALQELSAQLKTTTADLTGINQAHQAAVTTLSAKRGRLDVLRQMFGAPEGHSTIGHIIDCDPQYAAAIEAALHHNLHAVLADNLDAARQLLNGTLKNPSISAPDLAPAQAASNGDIPLGGIAWASEATRVRDSRFEPLIRSLLRTVLIVGDFDQALALRQYHPHLTMATLQGRLVDPHGIISAVSHSHIAEIASLQEDVNQHAASMADLAARKQSIEDQRAALDADLNQRRAAFHEREIQLASRVGELKTLSTEQRDLDNKLHTVVHELQAIQEQDADESGRRETFLAEIQEAESRVNDLRATVSAAQREVEDLTFRKEEKNQLLTDSRVEVTGLEHRRNAITSQLEPIAGRIHDCHERIENCKTDIESHTARIAQLQDEIAESEQRMAELQLQREQDLAGQFSGFQTQRTEVANNIQQAEDDLRSLRQQAFESQNQKSGCDLAIAQKRNDLQNLRDRIQQRYQVNLDEVSLDSYTVTVADQGPAITETVTIDTDWGAIETQVVEMQAKLDAMGPVNVEAIQEFDDLEERHRFLTQQHEDLVKGKEQLLHVIAKINATTKQLFHETFQKVRENFQVMFNELFGGGKADLLLADEHDPLESGIEIVAKPPGKQLQSITLLSGGEKTLTATALLFAIYMVKPSPFCVLDELDAPLDESNINRFIRILQRFVTQSQFVVITHNKRTIGMADALYGITMEEHGVSKVVSVKFSPRQEKARRQLEHDREEQEDRIDHTAPEAAPDAASAADAARDDAADVTPTGSPVRDVLPHEEDHHNDLLRDKEQRVGEISDFTPVMVAEPTPSYVPPPDEANEFQAALDNLKTLNKGLKQVIEPPKDPTGQE
jgi:chromosome segregation protein